jgi:membrane-associated phospholipid phosphatase
MAYPWAFTTALNLFFQNIDGALIPIMQVFTFMGSEYFYIAALPILYWCIDAELGIRIGVMLMVSVETVNFLKLAFHTPRPYWVDSRIHPYSPETSLGLPSGHSSNSASVWGVLAASLHRWWTTILIILVILMIGLSRIVLGAHFLQDVLSGFVTGAILLGLFLLLAKPIANWFNKLALGWQILVVVVSGVLLILPTIIMDQILSSYVLPAEWTHNIGENINPLDPSGAFSITGVWIGFFSGYAWLKYVQKPFMTVGTPLFRLARLPIGAIGLAVIYFGLKQVFPDTIDPLGLGLRLLRYVLLGFWVSAGAPLIFTAVGIAEGKYPVE